MSLIATAGVPIITVVQTGSSVYIAPSDVAIDAAGNLFIA
jgi:hypothetical protein